MSNAKNYTKEQRLNDFVQGTIREGVKDVRIYAQGKPELSVINSLPASKKAMLLEAYNSLDDADNDVESVISDLRGNNLDYKILQGKIASKRHSEGAAFDLGKTINSLTAFRINRIFKESFNFLIDFHQSLNLSWKLTPYILRHIYSALAWYYIKQDLIARDKWFDNAGLELAARGYVLGHMEGDLETPQIYADIRIAA